MKHKHLRLTNHTERKFKVTSHSLRLPFIQLGCFVNHKKLSLSYLPFHIFIFSFYLFLAISPWNYWHTCWTVFGRHIRPYLSSLHMMRFKDRKHGHCSVSHTLHGSFWGPRGLLSHAAFHSPQPMAPLGSHCTASHLHTITGILFLVPFFFYARKHIFWEQLSAFWRGPQTALRKMTDFFLYEHNRPSLFLSSAVSPYWKYLHKWSQFAKKQKTKNKTTKKTQQKPHKNSSSPLVIGSHPTLHILLPHREIRLGVWFALIFTSLSLPPPPKGRSEPRTILQSRQLPDHAKQQRMWCEEQEPMARAMENRVFQQQHPGWSALSTRPRGLRCTQGLCVCPGVKCETPQNRPHSCSNPLRK